MTWGYCVFSVVAVDLYAIEMAAGIFGLLDINNDNGVSFMWTSIKLIQGKGLGKRNYENVYYTS